MGISRVLCVLGAHRWAAEKTADGELYRRCRRCGKDDDGIRAIRGAMGADNQAWPR